MPIVLIEDILRPRLGLNTVRDGGRGQLSAGGSTARLAAAFAAHCRGGGADVSEMYNHIPGITENKLPSQLRIKLITGQHREVTE